VAIAFLSLGAIAPAGASALLDPKVESVIIDPGTGKLTTPAETIITNPTFLETFEEAAPEPQKQGLLRTLMGSRALPMIGRLLPAVGAGFLAYEICNAIFTGCISFSDSGDSGLPVEKWQWTNRGISGNGATSHAMVFTDGSNAPTYKSDGPPECPLVAVPQGLTGYGATSGTQSVFCPALTPSTQVLPTKFGERWPETWKVHYGGGVGTTTIPTSRYCRGWGASDSCQTPADTAGWSAAAATGLKEHVDPEVGQWVAAQIEGSGVADPYAVFVDVPSCSGEAWIDCKEALEELELVPERATLTWETAHLDLAPDEVVELAPAPATEVEKGTKVVVTTNPDEAGMPAVVPSPLPNETYDDYIGRLAPSLDPSRITVSPEFTDPGVGPDGVIYTVPKAGTRTNPATETEVDVHTNPADAPPPSTASWSPPAVPAIDLSPLQGVSIGCNDFPFGIFCWIGSGLTAWGPGGECPTIGVPFGSSIGLDDELGFDFCQFEPAMEIVRPVLILLSAFCLAWLFAAAAMGFGGSTGSDD
jgi:hypothetical protein